MLRVKICGITNLADAVFAADNGADVLGFIFAKSPRRVEEKTAAKIARALGERVATVGVFVDESPERMLRIAGDCGLTMLQLHGRETNAVVRRMQKSGFQVLKAFRMGEDAGLPELSENPADAFLLDTSSGGRFGGTGKTFDWELLKKKTFHRPWFVSGGLDAQNVKKLLSMVRPYGVDVSSGVESAPGKKNHQLVKEFIQHAKSAG